MNIGQTTFVSLTEKIFHNSGVATGCLVDLVEVFMLCLRILYRSTLIPTVGQLRMQKEDAARRSRTCGLREQKITRTIF